MALKSFAFAHCDHPFAASRQIGGALTLCYASFHSGSKQTLVISKLTNFEVNNDQD